MHAIFSSSFRSSIVSDPFGQPTTTTQSPPPIVSRRNAPRSAAAVPCACRRRGGRSTGGEAATTPQEALIAVAAAARPMGNVCVGNRFSKNRFFGHFSLWPARSRSTGTPSNPTTTSRSIPVVQVQPSESDAKPSPPPPAAPTAAPAPIVISEPAPAPLPQPQPTPPPSEPDPSPPPPQASQPQQPAAQPQGRQQSRKKAAHIMRISSAGLQVESVLRRKTENLKDKYSLGRKLGQGQFGTTYLCVDKGTGREYACKSIAKRKLITDEDVEDVRREIQIMHHLSEHPNVVRIRGAYEDALFVHIVMELCAGGELFDRIVAKGHYSEREAAKLIKTIVGVVEGCHSLGVMHRDLKPENFLFASTSEDAPLKATDFGLSMFYKPGMLIPLLYIAIGQLLLFIVAIGSPDANY